jgi:hypothetical protein
MTVIVKAPIFVFLLASQATGQVVKTPYPRMAPLSQYLMPRDAEISLARSAAPESVSNAAEILVFSDRGFQTAVKGTNGFVCMVARSWSADWNDPDFWDPRVRAPNCYNAAAAKSQVALTNKRTQVALSGGSTAQMFDAIKTAVDRGDLSVPEVGSMSYMLSKETYLSNRDGHWLPHLMFYFSDADPTSWGAGLPRSPIIGLRHPEERSTTFLVPVSKWSDGTPATPNAHSH